MDRHRLEAVCHVVVIEVLGVELLDRGAGLNAAHTAEPAVERLELHDAVHQHEGGDYGGQRVAHLPWDQVDELEQARQADLDPEQTEGAPHEHERGGRAPGEQDRHGIGDAGQQFVGVRPGDRAERGLHPPAHSSLEHAADQAEPLLTYIDGSLRVESKMVLWKISIDSIVIFSIKRCSIYPASPAW